MEGSTVEVWNGGVDVNDLRLGKPGMKFTYISDGSEDQRITGVQVQQMKRKIKDN